MTQTVSVDQAKDRLQDLLAQALAGHDVVNLKGNLCKSDREVTVLTAMSRSLPDERF